MSSKLLPKIAHPLARGSTICASSGRKYIVREVLAERREMRMSVYRASADGRDFIVKNLIPGEYAYQQLLQKTLASCPHLRTVVDGIAEPELFVYPFLRTDLLQFSQRNVTQATRKKILKDALLGLAALHERNIIHTDIKPNNILLDYEQTGDTFTVKNVQISDLEDAVLLPSGKYLRGALCGNLMWRSPESWARSAQGTASDMFSFGVVAIYVMLKDMVLRASDAELAADDAWRHVLGRQISFFANEDGFEGLLQWISQENPFFERLITLAGSFNAANPRKSFARWHFVDAQFRDLITRMTNLDLAKRITAAEALRHPWFASDAGALA